MKKLSFLLISSICIIFFTSNNVSAQSDKPYKDGPVWEVQYVKTKAGMNEVYLKDLATHWIKLTDAAKSRGYIMDYKVFGATPGSEKDWDLMLLIEFKNYAALDGIGDKMSALAKEILGSGEVQQQSAVSRNSMRDILGGKIAQELIFK